MAARYGGRFSPGASGVGARTMKMRPRRAGARVNLLFLAPFPLLVTAFGAGPLGMAVDLGAFSALVCAPWLLRAGLAAEDAYAARSVARRPAIPRKIFAAALTGLGVAAAVWDGVGAAGPIGYGAIAIVLHLAAFGVDPLRDKGLAGAEAVPAARVARAVDEAEAHLAAMAAAVAGLRDRDLDARVARFQARAREMFRTVERDPRDMSAARRYLGIYLIGARDAAQKLAPLAGHPDEPRAKEDFAALLDDLDGRYTTLTEKLLRDDRADLDIEISVLRERLAREGVRPGEGE